MVGLSSGFSCVNLAVESFSSDLPKMGLYNLVCVEWLKMINPMGVGFCSVRSRCHSTYWV